VCGSHPTDSNLAPDSTTVRDWPIVTANHSALSHQAAGINMRVSPQNIYRRPATWLATQEQDLLLPQLFTGETTKPPASTFHRRSQPSVAGMAHAASSPTGRWPSTGTAHAAGSPTGRLGHWHGTRRQLAYRPASAAGPALARHTPPARLPTATPALHRRRKFRHLFSYSRLIGEVPSSPLLLLATHRKKFLRHLFSCPFQDPSTTQSTGPFQGPTISLWSTR
jgi:hypothetical protein